MNVEPDLATTIPDHSRTDDVKKFIRRNPHSNSSVQIKQQLFADDSPVSIPPQSSKCLGKLFNNRQEHFITKYHPVNDSQRQTHQYQW